MRRDQAPQPAAPMRRGGVADIGDRRAARARRGRHAPAHHGQLATGASVAHDRCRIVGKYARHWLKVTDVAVDDAEQPDDRGLVGGDRIEIAHGRPQYLSLIRIPRMRTPISTFGPWLVARATVPAGTTGQVVV